MYVYFFLIVGWDEKEKEIIMEGQHARGINEQLAICL